MTSSSNTPFIPILTVMVDYGFAPFLWQINDQDTGGVGEYLCDSTDWDESFPMSEELWRKFADWATKFNRTEFFFDDFDDSDWDWLAFHACGLQLSRWLKEEVGEAYRVVYEKPYEDPNHRINERTEILADGTLVPFPPRTTPHFPEPLRFCERIISGGQTGVERSALDFAIKHSYTHGGWASHGREAEDGLVPLKYQLTELTDGDYRQHTRHNVEESDGTLIVNLGTLDGGTQATQTFAEQMGKPYLIMQLDAGTTAEAAVSVLAWLHKHAIKTLHVAGPRESKRPGIYHLTGELLQAIDAALHPA